MWAGVAWHLEDFDRCVKDIASPAAKHVQCFNALKTFPADQEGIGNLDASLFFLFVRTKIEHA